ncbi:MAG: S53 family peptidase [Candidatus Acidiferrales bacterium]
MKTNKVLLAFALFSLVALRASAQVTEAQPRIAAAVDDTKLTVLHGNTYPLARAQFDRGPAPDNLPMQHMLLVLKRSPAQEAALEKFLAEQLDHTSPNFHHWLSPAEFGQLYGPAQQDIDVITRWLTNSGFHVENVGAGRTTIQFSGTAGQVQSAFHTAIHQYVVGGKQHWANSTDPSIPSALTPVVAGVRSLHNFYPTRASHVRSAKEARRAQYSFPSGCSTNPNSSDFCSFGLSPADFDKIYNVSSSLTGSGQTIAIVSDSDIQVSNSNLTQPTDANQFRALFGLPAINFLEIETDPADDPGVSGPDGDEVEAALDVEWSGAVAPAATIDLVVSPSSETAGTFGGDISAQYIVNNNLAPILSYSYGECELGLGTTGNEFYQNLWQQAASEGISVMVSTGDNGSAGCDLVEVEGPPSQPAQFGLEVNGIASTPYNIAVGGTDFNDVTNPGTYWSASNNSSTQQSVLGYVPEMTWNDTCTNAVVYQYFGYTTALGACNSLTVEDFDDEEGIVLIGPTGASGGASTCTTSDGEDPSSCLGGYAKPTWQTALEGAGDGKRDLPDVSLFAGDGLISGSFYIDCEEDYVGVPCSLTADDYDDFLEVGGTSVSAQAMAGVMALVDQKTGARQGNANATFYSLASQQTPANCNASTPASSCVFYNVTVGTIAMPCVAGSPNCSGTGALDVGVLTGFDAGTGYNEATGIGTVNVTNLANASGWAGPSSAADFTLSSANPVATLSNGSGMFSFSIAAQNGFSGSVTFSCSALPTGDTCSTFSPASPVTVSGTTTVQVTVSGSNTVGFIPAHVRFGDSGRTPHGIVLLSFLWLAAILALALRRRSGRWGVALAAMTFACVIGIVGCGASNDTVVTTPPPSSSVATAVLTATGGGITHSIAFTIE